MNKRRRLLGTLAAGAMLVMATGVAVAATVTCDGGLCKGTKKSDRISGSALDDYIVAAPTSSFVVHAARLTPCVKVARSSAK